VHPTNSEWAIFPFCEGCSRRPFFQKNFRKTSLRKTSGRIRWTSRRTPEYVPEGCVPKFFRKKGLPEVILLAFFKMLYFSNYLILINKLRYKINNIIIHKFLVNIIMTNICNSFFTHM